MLLSCKESYETNKHAAGGGSRFTALLTAITLTSILTITPNTAMAVDVQTNGNPDLMGGSASSFIYRDKNHKFWQWGSTGRSTAAPISARYYPYPLPLPSDYIGTPTRIVFDYYNAPGSNSISGTDLVLTNQGNLYEYIGPNSSMGLHSLDTNVRYFKGSTSMYDDTNGLLTNTAFITLHQDGSVSIFHNQQKTNITLPGGRQIIAATAPFQGIAVHNSMNYAFVVANGGSIWLASPDGTVSTFMNPPTGIKFMDIGVGDGIYVNGAPAQYFHALDSQGRLWGWSSVISSQWTMGTPKLLNTGDIRFMKISDDGMTAIDSEGNPWLMSEKDVMSTVKAALPDGTTATQIATTSLVGATSLSVAVLDAKGRIWTRGDNSSFQLGDGTATDRDSWGLVAQNQFNNGGTDTGGTTISCAPTTGVAPDGLTRYGLLAASLLLVGLLVSAGLRRRLYC